MLACMCKAFETFVSSYPDVPPLPPLPGIFRPQAGPNTIPMLHWLMRRMAPGRDKLLMVRPKGLDEKGVQSSLVQRILMTFDQEARSKG